MNSTFYIFGKFNGSYAQFPVDYTQEIFQQLPTKSSLSNTKLVIHRDGKLMYYCYMRKLEQENYLGFCLLLNDAMITEFATLFEIFDKAVTQLALSGEIIKISGQGKIVSNTKSLLVNQQAIAQTASSLFAQLSPLVATKKTLPVQAYSTSQDETKTFMLGANPSWIANSSLTDAYTIIIKEYNTSNLSPKDELVSPKALWLFAVSIITVFGIFVITNNSNADKVILSEVETTQEMNEAKIASVSTNNTDSIKQNPKNLILAESFDALYYLGDQWMTLYCFDKRGNNLQTYSYENSMVFIDPSKVFFYGDLLVMIGNNNATSWMNKDVALFFNTKSKRFANILYARQIDRQKGILIASQIELVVKTEFPSTDDYFSWDEYYDLRGNLIDGKTIRGKGSIGKYQIEMSMHCLNGVISGWYKYKGHTNYMTIKGTIKDNDYFSFVEYNDKGERLGTFTGYADFESQTLSGYFHKGSEEHDFRISPTMPW